MKNQKRHRVFLIVPPHVQLLDITGPAHIFSEARAAGAEIELIYLSVRDTDSEVSEASVTLGNLNPFNSFECTNSDWIIVPGVEGRRLLDHTLLNEYREFYQWLFKQSQHGVKICSVCTGLYFLAYSNILNGIDCTTHWKYVDHIKDSFPKASVLNNRLFVKDHNIYSSAGVSSGIDLSLYLLEEAYGPLFAVKIAKEVVIYFRRAEQDPQLSIFLEYRNHLEARVHSVQNEISEQLEQNRSIEELAELVFMSPRNLTRLFKQHTGITIGEYQEKLRIERAVQLLAEGNKQETVAKACGISRSQLSHLLQKHKATLPIDLS